MSTEPLESTLPHASVAAGYPSGDTAALRAEFVELHRQEAARQRHAALLRRLLGHVGTAAQWLFGLASLVVGLAVLATIPIVQFASLGYLLEVSGRVARTGRLRDGFIGIRKAGQAGGIVAGVSIVTLPLWLVSSLWYDARLIDPFGSRAQAWHTGLVILSVLVVLHVIGACLRGGRLRSFLAPRPVMLYRQLLSPGAIPKMRDACWDFVISLSLGYFFWLGLRGFLGAIVWLLPPVSLLAVASRMGPALGVAVGLIGGALMTFVIVHLPFLQARFAAENRLGAMFEVSEDRARFRRAPLAYWFGLLFVLALALPLYLLKIEIVPREAAWLPSLLFVMSILPARLLTGWAVARASKRETPRHWFWRWLSRLAMLPVAGLYVLIVYFTQFLSWHGVWSLYEQHAFLVPVPFLGG